MRSRAWPIVVAFLLLGAACGQKAGVAGSVVAGAQTGTGDQGTIDGGLPVEGGGTVDGGVPVVGGGTTRGGGVKTTGGGKTATGGGGGSPSTSGGGGTAAGGGGGGTAAGGTTAGPADRTGITSTTIKIGIHAPKTGAAAVSTFDQGVGVYSKWAGKIKGLGNRQIEVVSRDDRFDPSTARSVCKELVEKEKVFILIGGAGVDAIKSCAEYAASMGVPYFSPGVTEGPFRNLQNYFALSETYTQQNVQVAQMIAHRVKKKNLGLVLTDSPLLNETEASIRAEAAKNGLVIKGKTQRLAHDAGKNQTDTVVSNLKQSGADVVYALISPTVFGFLVSSAKQQSYSPTFVGPGLSNGVNLLAGPLCGAPPPSPPSKLDVRYLSPMVQMDQIDSRDPNYKTAYRQKNGAGSQPDDIGVLLWGLEKTLRLMMEATGPSLSRQSLVKTLTSAKAFGTNVYAPVKYGGLPHFGASATTLLTLNCNRLEYDTTAAFVSKL
jgi:ABC-type branched-subunit amino acid transport system substrate-binding protein